MSQHHQGYQQQEEVHRDMQHYMHHVIPNTSSTAFTHGTGHAATNGPSSSFQTPGQAVSLSPYPPPVGDKSRVPSFSSSNQHASVVAVPKSLEPRPMGHGQSKLAPPLLPQSLTSAVEPVLDAGLLSTKGMSVAGGKLKRAFGAKRKESSDPYLLASKETFGEAIGVSKSISTLSRPTEYAPDSVHSSIISTPPPYPPSQVLDKYLVTSPSNLSQPSASFSGPTTAGSPKKHPKSSPSAAGNRSSVIDIALNPGISSAINFMMMECQDPSAPRLVINTSSSSLPSGDAEFSKPDRDNEKEALRRHSGGHAPTSPDKREMKESWRKSDSTNSHHTIRANSLRASRPVSWAESFHSAYTIVPAPQGPSSRRLSGLIADVDFGVREEELEEDLDANMENLSSCHLATIQDPNRDVNLSPDIDSPHRRAKDLLKKAKRRSISLSSALPSGFASARPLLPELPVATTIPVPAIPSATEVRKASHSISGMASFKNVGHPHVHTHLRQQSENLLLQRPPIPSLSSAPTHHVPSIVFSSSQLTSRSRSTQDNTPPQPPSALSDLNGKLQHLLPPLPKGPPAVPPDSSNSSADPFRQVQTQFPPPAISASHSSHHRQPTISSLGPSAAGIAKRAVGRMGKRLGDMMNLHSSSNNSISGHSSSTSISTSASTSITSGTSLIPSPLTDGKTQIQVQGPLVPSRTASRGSIPSSPMSRQGSGHAHHHSVIHNFLPGTSKSGGHKRLQRSLGSTAAMGEVTTSGASSSNLSSASESDPFSPTGPILGRRLRGPTKKGHVFGRELRLAIKETKVAREDDEGVDAVEGSPPRKVGLIKVLECRVLPAVVARCAQHLLIWGVQEEGLFRVNGRPRHVSHLRAEFDSGADYDMTECSPGELDPHAVASVFKAYLRELPDSILTKKLQPYFDAAINKENTPNSSGQQPKSHSTKGLPSCPRDVTPASLRKPPSLSTLAMPSFNHVPPPSISLTNAFRSLIAQLPPENRDLLRTVVDLIKATARGSKATKMPLSNLLLLFCPSLNLSPPLLRLLCEAEGIWEEERIYLSRGVEEGESDGEPPVLIASKQNKSAPRDVDEADARSGFDEASSLRSGRASSDNPSSLDYHASAEEDSLFSEERAALGRRDTASRPEIPTVYLDTQSHLSSSSGSLLQDTPETNWHTESYLVHQDVPDDGSISSDPYSPKPHKLSTSPSLPLLSSSADSISTHTSSTNPSLYNLPLDGAKDTEKQKCSDVDLPSGTVKPSPQFVVVEPLEIRKRPLISNPIPIPASQFPFPTSRGREHAPTAPSRRRSIPLLSLSSLSSRSSGSPSPSPLRNSPYHAESRSKKTSLKLLFSKKSSSSLLEDKERPIIRLPFLHTPFQQERASPRSGSGSDSSVSTPISAVTAPQGSGFFSLLGGSQDGPPVLNTLIEDSSLKFDEAMNSDKEDSNSRSVSDDPVSHWKSSLSNLNTQLSPSNRPPSSQSRNEEWMRSVYMTADADLSSHSKLR